MADPTGRPLDELAVQLVERECQAKVYGGTLVTALNSSAVHEWAIATDGERFRWGSEHGDDLGPIEDVEGAAERAVSVMSESARNRWDAP